MHEIIHLSASHTANHLQTHFYNSQETYFVFDEASVKDSRVDPHVLFRQGKGFTPRALIWELRGGYGGMKGHSGVYQDEIEKDVTNWGGEMELMNTTESVARSEYQQALDAGQTPPKLNRTSTKYWSDYLNMYYHPSSLQTLNNWEYHPDKFPKGQARGGEHQFVDYSVGVDQWQDLNNENDKEYLEDTFRPALELCDQVSGLSFTTEIDSAWGGFSAEILAELRDNHVPKLPIFTWALHDAGKLSRQQELSRIRTTCSMVENSTLFIPMQPPVIPASFDRHVDLTSKWHLTALYNTVYESFSILSSLRDGNRVSMQEISDALQRGTKRNIVGQVQSGLSDKALFDFSLGKTNHVFAKTALKRPPKQRITDMKPKSLADYLNPMTVVDPWESYFQEQQLIDDGTPENALTKYTLDEPYAMPHSQPDFVLDTDEVYAGLAVTDAPRATLKAMTDMVTRIKVDDREELKDQLSSFSSDYVWGYDASDESDDDM